MNFPTTNANFGFPENSACGEANCIVSKSNASLMCRRTKHIHNINNNSFKFPSSSLPHGLRVEEFSFGKHFKYLILSFHCETTGGAVSYDDV